MAPLGESVCPYCGVGFRLRNEGDDRVIVRIRGVERAPANLGRLCAKGARLGPTIQTPDRAKYPLRRRSRSGLLARVTWDESHDFIGEKFRRVIADHGPDAVAFYGSGQLDSETAYLACKLFKGFIGTNNTDSNSRLCMAATAAGYRGSLGRDGPPSCPVAQAVRHPRPLDRGSAGGVRRPVGDHPGQPGVVAPDRDAAQVGGKGPMPEPMAVPEAV